MPHWTDDPKIHELMTHLGKTGKTGKPTRSAFIADKVNVLMLRVEPLLAAQRAAAAEEAEVTREYERVGKIISERKPRQLELEVAIAKARADLLRQNPNANIMALDAESNQAMWDFEDEQEKAEESIEDLKKSVTMKRTAMRRNEDRIENYRKQVFALIDQSAAGLAA